MPIFGKDSQNVPEKDAKDYFSKALDAGLTPKEAEGFIKGVEVALTGFHDTTPRFHDSMKRVKALFEEIDAKDILKLDAKKIEEDHKRSISPYSEAMVDMLDRSVRKGIRLNELEENTEEIWNSYLAQTIGDQREIWKATERQIGILIKICRAGSGTGYSLSRALIVNRFGSDIILEINNKMKKKSDAGYHYGTFRWQSWCGGYFVQYAGSRGRVPDVVPDVNLGVALLFFQFRDGTILLNGKEFPMQFYYLPGTIGFNDNYERLVEECAEFCKQSPWLYVDPQGNASLGDYRNLRREK